MDPFFFRLRRQHVLSLPSALTHVEKQNCSVLRAGTVQCVCRIMYMNGCAYAIFVCGSQRGSRCGLAYYDIRIDLFQRKRQDAKIQQCIVKTTGSSPDSWISIQTITWTACMYRGKGICGTIFIGESCAIQCGLRSPLGSTLGSRRSMFCNRTIERIYSFDP